MPITEKNLPFELTVSCLLMADARACRSRSSCPEQLKPFVPLDRPISEETGVDARRSGPPAEREAAEQQLSFPVGGIRPTKFRIQLTGGAVELPPSKAGLFQKDTEVDIVVAGITLSGWVKTDKNTTEKKGGVAVREAVIVLEGGDD
jgi:hypothetical protein